MSLTENKLVFKHFKPFAAFLLENIEEVTDEYLRLAEEINPAWLNWFPDKSALKAYCKKSLVSFYESILDNSVIRHSENIINQWKGNQIPEIKNLKLTSSDIIKAYTLRRITNFSFIDRFTTDIKVIKEINLEVERLYGFITEYTINVYLDIYQGQIQSVNEELRANEEELQTINEELRENQEELQSINEELREQVEQRKQVEEALHKERIYLETILENVSDGIVACDESGRLSYFNKASRNFHGLTEKGLYPEQWSEYYDLYNSDGINFLSKEEIPLYKAFKGDKIENVEIIIAPRNGKKRWFLCSGNPIKTDNKILGAVVVMHDITERKDWEKKLLENQQMLQEANIKLQENQEELQVINEELIENHEELQTLNEELREQIEQRIAREEDLKMSKLKYQTIAENLEEAQSIAHVGSWEFDLSTNSVKWSSELYRIFGYKPDEIRVDYPTYLNHIPPAYIDALKSVIENTVQNKEPYSIEHKIRTKEGKEKWVQGQGKAVVSVDGKVIGLKGVATDITERKKTELEVFEKNQELSQLLEELKSAEEHLVILNNELEERVKERTEELEIVNNIGKSISSELDLNVVVQKVTDVTTKLTGAEFGAFFYNVKNEKDELLTLYAISGVDKEHFSKFPMPRKTKVFSPTLTGEGIVRVDDITKDPRYGHNPPYNGMPEGHLPVKSYLSVPVISRTGEILGGLFFGHSKAGIFKGKAESLVEGIASQAAIAIDNATLFESAQANQQRLKSVLESMPAIAWTANGEGEMDYFNEQFYNSTGKTLKDSSGWGWTDVVHPEEISEVTEKLKYLIKEGREFQTEFRIKNRHGFKWQLFKAVPFKDGNNIIKWFGTCTDIEEQKESSYKLQETNKELLKINEFLDTFVYIAAHDLRSPLSNLKMILELLNKVADPAKKQELLNALSISVNKLDQTVNGLVKIIEIQSTDTSMVKNIRFLEVFENIKEDYLREIQEENISFSIDFSEKADVNYIEAYLVSIIKNIVGNAIKYHSPKRSPIISITTCRDGEFILLKVSDNGVGMDLGRYGKNIFKPFTRFSKIADGKGLGLYLVKNMVEKNGGKIVVESQVDSGTTFKIYLKEY